MSQIGCEHAKVRGYDFGGNYPEHESIGGIGDQYNLISRHARRDSIHWL